MLVHQSSQPQVFPKHHKPNGQKSHQQGHQHVARQKSSLKTHLHLATPPIIPASNGEIISAEAVTATKPANAPFKVLAKSGRLLITHDVPMAVATPAAPPSAVVTNTSEEPTALPPITPNRH